MILIPILLSIAAGGANLPAIYVPADGKKHRVTYNNATYKVRITGDQIYVDHIEKVFGHNLGPDVRDGMRQVAKHVSQCDLADEYFTIWLYALEARMVCPAKPSEGGGQ